ncbi:MAG: DNA polymerase III subunit gamma/tau [Betaproteobacteria bacterium]
MPYQVLARKWRPQRFDEVVGQQAVTRTLRNALASGRLAQAFVFAGPRGVGKTTTARILARALNCVNGPTPDPCGTCDACVEIAEGRDIDVLEIDAATHTGIDNVREVIIAGLSIRPVRNRYKIFIIDEVHQLSGPSFNALLKSIEEPPPHVVFMMATTELDKIPETVLSRSQVYEFRTIGTRAIAEQLRRIVDAEGIATSDEALQLIARDAEGSLRDAESKLDQVIAFTGTTVTVDDVATVLGLVGRDLLLDAVQAVADEDAPAAFALAARAVESGYDLRAVVRELSRVVRDLLVLNVDPSRIADPEIAGEGERARLEALAARFSREDLLRAFDLLARAENDVRGAAQPRYHLEMALLRWIHLRKLVPLEDLLGGGGGSAAKPVERPARAERTGADPGVKVQPERSTPERPAAERAAPERSIKDAFFARVRAERPPAYGAVLAQAQRIEFGSDRVVLTFAASQKMGAAFEKYRPFFEETASKVAGRRVAFTAEMSGSDAAAGAESAGAAPGPPTSPDAAAKQSALRQEALADSAVQALLEVFPAEIRDIEEM